MAVSCLASPSFARPREVVDCVWDWDVERGVEGESERPDSRDMSESVSSCVCSDCSPAEAHHKKPS